MSSSADASTQLPDQKIGELHEQTIETTKARLGENLRELLSESPLASLEFESQPIQSPVREIQL